MPNYKSIPGINIQWPWSQLLVSGQKVIETRSYAIPEKLIGIELAIIETPGPRGKKDAGILKAQIVGTIKFTGCKRYRSKREWVEDIDLHLVEVADPQFKFSNEKEKWGWIAGPVRKFKSPLPAPAKRGIIFAKQCKVIV